MQTHGIKPYPNPGYSLVSAAGAVTALLVTMLVMAGGCKDAKVTGSSPAAAPPPAAGTVATEEESRPLEAPEASAPAQPAISPSRKPTGPSIAPSAMEGKAKAMAACSWRQPTPECAEQLASYLEASMSANAEARATALGWLTLPVISEQPAVIERLVQMVRADPSQMLRRRACRRMGRIRDPKVLATLSRYSLTRTAQSDPGLYAACFAGLVDLWAAPQLPQAPLAEAYRFTLKRLLAKPRNGIVPPTAVLQQLRQIPAPRATTERPRAHRRWLSQSRPFYKVAELVSAVEDVAADAAVPWQTRLVAAEVLIHHGLPNSRLGRLAETIEGESQPRGSAREPQKPMQNSHLKAVADRLRGAMKPAP